MKLTCTLLLLVATLQLPAQTLDLSKLSSLNIRNVGPANMSGRITAIDVVESDPNTLYVGAASGGVYGDPTMEGAPGVRFLMRSPHKILAPWPSTRIIPASSG